MKEETVAVREKEKGYSVILFDLFRSVNLTIFLLILLAILSIIGTVITQNAATEAYIERYGEGLYEVLDFFGLFDMYHSWWFSTILVALVVNLVACSLNRFPGVWNQFFRKSGAVALEDSMVKILPYVEKVKISDPSRMEGAIQSQVKLQYVRQDRLETESAVTLFSEKGKFSRLGVYIAHLSLIIILIGGLIGSFFGFKGFVNIFEGETVDRIGIRTKNKAVERAIPFSVRCDDFKVTFYDVPGNQRFVKEYTSILTILESGKEVLKQTVRVNHPLHYRGLTFYQSSYGSHQAATIGVQSKGKKEKVLLKITEGETVPIPNSNAGLRMVRYVPQVLNLGEGLQMILLKPNQPPRPIWALQDPSKLDQRDEEFIVSFEGISVQEYTGLQVAKDPGVWVVWIGCALLIVGLVVSFFFSHQRIWVRIPKGPGKEIVIAGSTSKNRVGFEKTFQQLVGGIRAVK
jgi:cytochrome c biogenesis protein